MELRIQCLCFDTLDPMPVAAFWQEALGWRRTYSEPDEIVHDLLHWIGARHG